MCEAEEDDCNFYNLWDMRRDPDATKRKQYVTNRNKVRPASRLCQYCKAEVNNKVRWVHQSAMDYELPPQLYCDPCCFQLSRSQKVEWRVVQEWFEKNPTSFARVRIMTYGSNKSTYEVAWNSWREKFALAKETQHS